MPGFACRGPLKFDRQVAARRYPGVVAKRVEDLELDPAIVPIADDTDKSPGAVRAWLATLAQLNSVDTSVSAAELIRDHRER